jgi:hypothetical protein
MQQFFHFIWDLRLQWRWKFWLCSFALSRRESWSVEADVSEKRAEARWSDHFSTDGERMLYRNVGSADKSIRRPNPKEHQGIFKIICGLKCVRPGKRKMRKFISVEKFNSINCTYSEKRYLRSLALTFTYCWCKVIVRNLSLLNFRVKAPCFGYLKLEPFSLLTASWTESILLRSGCSICLVRGFVPLTNSNVPHIKKLNKNQKVVHEDSAKMVAYFRTEVFPYFG